MLTPVGRSTWEQMIRLLQQDIPIKKGEVRNSWLIYIEFMHNSFYGAHTNKFCIEYGTWSYNTV
jgi:hypothetical protein